MRPGVAGKRWVAAVAMLLALAGCGVRPGAPANTDWPLLGNTPEMQHHADLAQVNKESVKGLELAWWTEIPSQNGLVGNPLVQDGVVFQGGPRGQIFANDVRTGKLLWKFAPQIDLAGASLINYAGMQVNRGLALWKDLAIIAADCRLFAVDQKTGQQRWETQACDRTKMYAATAAPRVAEGLVFMGNACADSGMVRGYLDAFDAETGKRRWRFYSVPDDPSRPQESPLYDMAVKTWGTGWYAKTLGCGSVWDAVTYDPKLHQLYIGVGGLSPFDPSQRPPDAGDELFTNSVVALDVQTGAYKWHFKQVPHDGWNYEPSIGLMVADLPVAGQTRRVVLSVPKSGFAYVLDAETGRFISGGAYTGMNWAKGLDAQGRPILDPEGMYWLRPGTSSVILPGALGAHSFDALAYDPKGNLLYIPVMVMPTKYVDEPGQLIGGQYLDFYYGSSGDPKWKSFGEVVAWDPVANAVKWRVHEDLPINGGLMHTSGGLVFEGMADGRLVAFDDATGKELWSRQTGGAVRAAPSTVMVDGEQYILVATGNGGSAAVSYMTLYNGTPESRTPPRLLAFRLGGKSAYPPLAKVEPMPKPPAPRQDAKLALKGHSLYTSNICKNCHGINGAGPGNPPPNLNRMPPASLEYLKTVVQQGALAARGMPQFKHITGDDAKALYAYIINEAWDAYDQDQARLKAIAK